MRGVIKYTMFLVMCIAEFDTTNILTKDARWCFCQIWFTAKHKNIKMIHFFVSVRFQNAHESWMFLNTKIDCITIPHLSNDGSLLNISVGTVAGASTIPINDCFDCKCLSTSSAVIWPSVIVSVFMTDVALDAALFAFFCVCFLRFDGLAFLFCELFDALFFLLQQKFNQYFWACCCNAIKLMNDEDAYFLTFSVRLPSSSDDSVSSSLSDSELSGFSYWSKRSSKNERSRVTFNRRRWLDRRASWKNSFSYWANQKWILLNDLFEIISILFENLRKVKILISFLGRCIAICSQHGALIERPECLGFHLNHQQHSVHYPHRDHCFELRFDLPSFCNTNRPTFCHFDLIFKSNVHKKSN